MKNEQYVKRVVVIYGYMVMIRLKRISGLNLL